MTQRLFAVGDFFFEDKGLAKIFRNGLIGEGKKAHVSYGPDHQNHQDSRPVVGWNRGKHPKKAKGRLIK